MKRPWTPSKASEMAEFLIDFANEPDGEIKDDKMFFDLLLEKKKRAIELLKEIEYEVDMNNGKTQEQG